MPEAIAAACSALHRAVGQFGDHGDGVAGGIQLAGGDAAEFEKILLLQARRLAGADHDQALGP